MEHAKEPEMYKACPYRNVDAAFARFYDAFVLVVLDPGRARTVDSVRADRIVETKEENNILKSVTETGDHDTPDLDANKDAVQGVISGKKSKK